MGNRDFLILKTGKQGEICLKPHQKITFGRDSRADFVFDDRKLSGLHFAVEYKEVPILQDLNSTNGTRVNGHRVCCKKLKSGDVILAGKSQFAVEFRPAPKPSVTRCHSGESTLVMLST